LAIDAAPCHAPFTEAVNNTNAINRATQAVNFLCI
jgi:hypothetical protein